MWREQISTKNLLCTKSLTNSRSPNSLIHNKISIYLDWTGLIQISAMLFKSATLGHGGVVLPWLATLGRESRSCLTTRLAATLAVACLISSVATQPEPRSDPRSFTDDPFEDDKFREQGKIKILIKDLNSSSYIRDSLSIKDRRILLQVLFVCTSAPWF